MFIVGNMSNGSGRVVIASVLPNGELFSVMTFTSFDKFVEFVTTLEEFINTVKTPIPSAILKAFEEEKDEFE